MKFKLIIPILSCFFLPFFSLAQADPFEGTWHLDYTQTPGTKSISMDLLVGAAEKNLLYPAEMTLRCDSFIATYHLLLVKRNIRQLAIGRNKIPETETPFTLGNYPVYLNGVFDLSRDIKGVPLLTAERMPAKQYGIDIPDIAGLNSQQKTSSTRLRDFLKDGDMQLKKISNDGLHNQYTDSILQPNLSADYYGITDLINVDQKNGSVTLSGNKKSANGIVSVLLNGSTIIDQNDMAEKKAVEDIKLDTGLNILVFFADNYGKTPASTGSVQVDFGNRKFSLDFANKKDAGATFIVVKLYYSPDKEKEKLDNSAYSNSILRELSESDLQNDIKNYHYPDPEARNLLKNDTARAIAEKALLRNTKAVGNIKANARKIILALWDDAVEDGDSISLNINGHWVVQGFPVKKKPQFIQVTLDAGANKIIFIADNLGSIIPNTAVLEIIDGRQRKSFMIDTDLSSNNLINILYQLRPGD